MMYPRLPGEAACFLLLLTVFVFSFCGPPKPTDVPDRIGEEELEAVPPYSEVEPLLSAEEWQVRSNAVLDVSRGKYREAIPRLMAMLGPDEHPAVRNTAALALADFEHAPAGPKIEALLSRTAVDGGNPQFLMDALVRLGDPRFAGAIVPFLDSERSGLRLKAQDSLKQLNATAQGSRILKMAQENLRSGGDPEKAKIYAMALGNLKVRSGEAYLLELARRSEPGPTLAAAYLALGRVESRRAVPTLINALSADFDKGRENAVAALIQIGDAGALERLYDLLGHENAATRFAAAEVIVGIPHRRSGPAVLAILAEGSPRATAPAAYVLGRLKYEPARKIISVKLKDPKHADREALARALGWLGAPEEHPETTALLIDVLGENGGEGRYGAAWSLGILGVPEALEPLRRAARSDDRKLALLAVEALGGLRTPAALPDLERAVKGNAAVRYAALDSIASIPGDEARLILEGFATGTDPDIQLVAVRALGTRREEQSVPLLVNIVQDASTETARAAMLSLRSITGQDFESRSQWVHWFEVQNR